VNEDVYIIGGGSSLKGFDFKQLEDKDTIAVNVSAFDVPNPTYCITADSGIFRKLQEGYFDRIKTSWVVVSNPNHCSMKWKDGKFTGKHGFVYNLFTPNILIRNAGTDGIGFSFSDFRTGYNSGFCAFQLAILLRYKKIHLLGFDLHKNVKQIHYHNKYHNTRTISDNSFEKFYNNFALALKIIKEKTDIKVVSHSSISRLNKILTYKPLTSIKLDVETTQEAKTPEIGIITKDEPKTLKTASRDLKGKAGKVDIKLSILICSLKKRHKALSKLLDNLQEQCTEEIEILVDTDQGQITTGAKRNKLLQNAVGNYIAFVDDDDMVSDDYVSKILQAIQEDSDCCSLQGLMTNKRGVFKFIHSLEYKSWFKNGDMYYRYPNHLNPVKRELALKIGFPNISKGEDRYYSDHLYPLLKTEAKITGTIYYYLTR